MAEILNKKYKPLKDYRFPEILLNISNSGKTGILHLKNWPAEKLIYIKNGKIIFASSNIEEDCLGTNLLKKGKITVVQYYESIRLIEKTGKRHGFILTELGYLSPKDLEDAVREQVEDIVLSVFKWDDGYFFFEDGSFAIDEPITLNTDTIIIICKGIKGMDSFPQIRRVLPLTTVLTLSSNSNKLIKRFKFDETEKKVINLIDGKNTVLEILTNIHGDDLETLKVLYTLNCIEAAISADYSPNQKEAMLNAISTTSSPETLYKKGTELFMSGNYSASVNIFREAIDRSPHKATYHFYLAMSLLNTSNLDDAEDALIRAIEIEPFNDDYYTELGMVYTKHGLFEKASKAFEFALRLNPHNERARDALSDIRK